MTSKSSFWGSLKENSKRRLWVWVLAVLAFVLMIPLALAMQISRIYQQAEWLTESYGRTAADAIIHNNLFNAVTGMLGPSAILMILAIIFAAANAVQGFSWLYSRKKIDFYMGMPVKRSKRFLVIWLNGIFIYIIPYILGLVVSMLIAAGNHGLDMSVSKIIFQAFFVHLLLYLCFYHLALLAVMLTGNMVITGMGFVVFCLYEWVVRRVDYVYKSRFFRYFNLSGYHTDPVFSPISMYSKIISDPAAMLTQGGMLLMMFVFVAVLGVLSYICYLKRPAEAAGKAMAFSITKPVIKILLVVPMALLMGDMIANEVNYIPQQGIGGEWYVILVLALMCILGSGIIQVLYEFDIKGALHQKRHIVISGVLVALIFMAYRYDLLKYDSYVPDPEKVDSIAFLPDNYETVDYRSAWIDADGKDISSIDYVERYMYLKNTADVCDLAEYSMKKYDATFRKGEAMVYDDETDSYWASARIIYRMKSGKEVLRRIWVDVNDTQSGEYLDRIIGSREFKEGYLLGASDRLSQFIDQNEKYEIEAYYGNLVYEQKMRKSEILELLECYKADVENFNFTRVKESTPVGVIRVESSSSGQINNGEIWYPRAVMTSELGINIYPFFDRSIACLKKYGYYMDRQLDVEDVDRIYIVNQNSNAYQELQDLQKTEAGAEAILEDMPAAEAYGIYDIDTRGYADYTNREDIEKLADCIYAEGMLSGRWDGGATYDYDYNIMVYFKADSNMNRIFGSYASYDFKEGEIPEFVQEDTAFKLTK